MGVCENRSARMNADGTMRRLLRRRFFSSGGERYPMTMRKSLALVALLAVSALSLSGCSAGNPAAISPSAGLAPEVTPLAPRPATVAPARKTIELTILHTNDSRGFVDPCG